MLGARVTLRQEQLLAEAAGGRARGDAAQLVCGRGCAGSTGEEAEEHEEEARGRGERSSWAHHVRRCLLYSLPILSLNKQQRADSVLFVHPARPDATQPGGYPIIYNYRALP